MHRLHAHSGLLVAAIAAAGFGGIASQAAVEFGRFMDAARQLATADPSRPTPAATRSHLSKLRDLNFHRGRPGKRRYHFKGLAMSVAEGQRRARKRRNVLRERARHRN